MSKNDFTNISVGKIDTSNIRAEEFKIDLNRIHAGKIDTSGLTVLYPNLSTEPNYIKFWSKRNMSMKLPSRDTIALTFCLLGLFLVLLLCPIALAYINFLFHLE